MKRQVYGLFASDEPLQIRYVGITTQDTRTRLRGHHLELKRRFPRKNHRKSDWIQSVLDRGAEVNIRLLSSHDDDDSMFKAEAAWMNFWAQYCDLLNLDRTGRRSGGSRKVVSVTVNNKGWDISKSTSLNGR